MGCDTGISFLYVQTTFGGMKQEQIKIVCRPNRDYASRRKGSSLFWALHVQIDDMQFHINMSSAHHI